VEKPGRYVGGEYGALEKAGAALSVAVSYPDLYEIGMSNSAIKILYAILNGVPDVSCERVFAPAPDFERELRVSGIPLFSLETGRPLRDFDVLGFSIGYELTLTNMLAILDSGGVSLEHGARGAGEPIVIAGGPAVSNPVPIGPFVDCVFIGEAEGWAERTFSTLAEMKKAGAGREALLEFLRGDPSVWYAGRNGTVRRALWRGFAASAAEALFPVPSVRVVQDHGSVEIMRGCPNACTFCHATVFYRPCRRKAPEAVRREIEGLVRRAGYRHITLASLSSGDYRGIHDLARELNARYAPLKVSFSLPSLRIDTLALRLLREISEVRKSGLTFAVETATPEWQQAVRKPASLERTIAILREARSLGWRAAKFYFMVGLPASFDEDESTSIVEFLLAVHHATGMSLNVNVAAFIPKPHTPFARAPQIGEEEATRRITAVRKALPGGSFKIGFHAPFLSLLEGVVSRGDERAGALVLDAFRRGARLDAWEEHIRLDVWRQAIAEAGWDAIGETRRRRDREEKLPWDQVLLGLSSSEIADVPEARQSQVIPRPVNPTPAIERAEVVTRRGEWQRALFQFEKTGAASFISHLDLMTVMERALLRAGFDARFTEGFNPKPRLEFASPLGLGIESTGEIAAADLYDYSAEADFMARMNRALPPGLRIVRSAIAASVGASKRRSLMSLFRGSEYSLKLVDGRERTLILPNSAPSIRRTLEKEKEWEEARLLRTRTFAAGEGGEPVSYFEVFGPLLRPSSVEVPDSSALT
jgi:radical SAM-linked protein